MDKAFSTFRAIVNLTLGFVVPTPLPIFILCYHGFGDTSYPHNLSVSEFTKQIEYLSKRFNIVSIREIVAHVKGEKSLTTPALAISFDDGYKSLLDIEPLIHKYRIRPTVFVMSDPAHVNRKQLENELPLLTTKQIEKLMLKGWDIGLHTATHPDLRELSKSELLTEITIAKSKLEKKLSTSIDYFAYPKGAYTEGVVEVVRKSGFHAAFTMDDNQISNGSDLYTLSRIGINASHSIREFPTLFTPLVQAVRRILK